MDMPDAEMIGKQCVHVRHVAYCHQRKSVVVRFSCGGIFRQRPGRAVVGSYYVGAYDKPFVGIKKSFRFHRVWPPVGDVAVGGEGMTYPYDI